MCSVFAPVFSVVRFLSTTLPVTAHDVCIVTKGKFQNVAMYDYNETHF
jgi:hypothetical protein